MFLLLLQVMPRPKGPPTKVIRLPADVVDALQRRAARKGMTVGAYLRAALGDAKEPKT